MWQVAENVNANLKNDISNIYFKHIKHKIRQNRKFWRIFNIGRNFLSLERKRRWASCICIICQDGVLSPQTAGIEKITNPLCD